jgi:hypothetical protein
VCVRGGRKKRFTSADKHYFFSHEMTTRKRKKEQQQLEEARNQVARIEQAQQQLDAARLEQAMVEDRFAAVQGAWSRWMEQLARADRLYGKDSNACKAHKSSQDKTDVRALAWVLYPCTQARRDGLGMEYVSQRASTLIDYLTAGPGASPWVRRYWFQTEDDAAIVSTLMPINLGDQMLLSMHGVCVEIRTINDQQPVDSFAAVAIATKGALPDHTKLIREQLQQLRTLMEQLETHCQQTHVLLSTCHDAQTSRIINSFGEQLNYSDAQMAHIRAHLLEHQARRLVTPFCSAHTHERLAALLTQVQALVPLPPVRRKRM